MPMYKGGAQVGDVFKDGVLQGDSFNDGDLVHTTGGGDYNLEFTATTLNYANMDDTVLGCMRDFHSPGVWIGAGRPVPLTMDNGLGKTLGIDVLRFGYSTGGNGSPFLQFGEHQGTSTLTLDLSDLELVEVETASDTWVTFYDRDNRSNGNFATATQGTFDGGLPRDCLELRDSTLSGPELANLWIPFLTQNKRVRLHWPSIPSNL